ncbi:hypothetical protein [Neptuniibacter halophilus]|uniref:hypothetical protein n=1 Tax=Neptuniibacter halophilus TaxID=651666 RepID=UPI002573F771|nr:hypothetical protein [Neptuniibacter halophilus]
MNCDQLGELIDEGLTIRDLMLIRYLAECDGSKTYVSQAEMETRLTKRFIERSWENKKKYYQKVLLEPLYLVGATKPVTVGIGLTGEAIKIAQWLSDEKD